MDVLSTCPLRVASVVWQPRPGAWALTVICKATFQLQPGVSPLAETQEAPVDDDGYWDDDETRSLHAPSDLVPFRARADVLLVGQAFAPGGQPVRSLVARLAIGGVDKRVEVWCDRIFWHEGRLLEGQPFVRMPLRWERAAGGPGTTNPVGMRFDAPPDAHGAVRVPNLQPPGIHLARRGDTFAPAGFGPLAAHWSDRAGKLGRHAVGWSHPRWRERPLPADLDRGYFNTAPADQQVESLLFDEPIVLENLHPEHPRLETHLFGVTPAARMTAGGRAGEEVALLADTLWIDTDRGIATVVWRGRVPLVHPAEEGCVTVSVKGAGIQSTVLATETMALGSGGAVGRALPFGEVPAATETLLGGRAGGPALPFGAAPSRWAGPPPEPATSKEPPMPENTGTVFGVRAPAREALPFVPDTRRTSPPGSTPPAPPEATPPAEPAGTALSLGQAMAGQAMVGRLTSDRRSAPPPPAEVRPIEPVAPPPMWGPLAAAGDRPAPEADATPLPPPIEAYPIERCARIAARLARRPRDAHEILAAEELAPERWEALRSRWAAEMRREARRGRKALLGAYDAAYVAALEEERGPIGAEDYARLIVAGERGRADALLRRMGLPRGAMMRIRRVWLARMVQDRAVAAAVRAAVRMRGKGP
jgi:hypothetical protein